MPKKYGVVPDHNLFINLMRHEATREDIDSSRALLEYATKRKRIFTSSKRKGFLSRYLDSNKDSMDADALREYIRILSNYKIRDFDMDSVDERVGRVIAIYSENGFTNEFNLARDKATLVPRRFRHMAKLIYIDQISEDEKKKREDGRYMPEATDIKLIGYASLLTREFERVFLASCDRGIIGRKEGREVAAKIEKEFSIRIDHPSAVLEEIRALDASAVVIPKVQTA